MSTCSMQAIVDQLFATKKFPGSLPVDVDHRTYKDLVYGYVGSFKADGVRALLLVSPTQTCFMYRDGSIENMSTVTEPEFLFLFDVEIMGCTVMLFDCLVYMGTPIIHRGYSQRMEACRKYIHTHIYFKPRHVVSRTCASKYLDGYVQLDATHLLTCKPIFHVADVGYWWANKEQVPFTVDGIIFTRLLTSYEPFRTNPMAVLKWKPPDQLTIDVQVTSSTYPVCNRVPPMFMHTVGNMNMVSSDGVIVSRMYTANPLREKSVYECRWDGSKWVVLHERSRKTSGNHSDTIIAILGLIVEPVHMCHLDNLYNK